MERTHDDPRFEISFHAQDSEPFIVRTSCAILRLAHLIHIGGQNRVCQSVRLSLEQQPDGAIAIRVLSQEGEQGEPRVLACMISAPDGSDRPSPARCKIIELNRT